MYYVVDLHHLIFLSAEHSNDFFNRKGHVRRDRVPLSTFCQSYDSFLHWRELQRSQRCEPGKRDNMLLIDPPQTCDYSVSANTDILLFL